MTDIEKLLELIDVYEDLVTELQVTYYAQDSDKIRILEEKKEVLLGESGVYWVDNKPRLLSND